MPPLRRPEEWRSQEHTSPGPRVSLQIGGRASAASNQSMQQALDRLQSASDADWSRSEEHTSELQSRQYLVCRLLLEKKKKKIRNNKTQQKQQKTNYNVQ